MGMTEVMRLPQESPSKWGARVDYDARRPAGPKDSVIVHYPGESGNLQASLLRSGHSACRSKVRSIEQHHLGKGWSGGGYNFIVCPHGTLLRMRGRGSAAHNPADSDNDGRSDNIDGLGVQVLVGNSEQPAPAALQMLQRVCDSLNGGVYPHSASRSTSCPGDHLRAWVKNYTTGGAFTAHPSSTFSEEENVLTKGSKGDAVSYFQTALRGWDSGALPKFGADGDYGDEMTEWVGKYQRAADLTPTGNVDGVTGVLLGRHHPEWKGVRGSGGTSTAAAKPHAHAVIADPKLTIGGTDEVSKAIAKNLRVHGVLHTKES